MKCSLSAGRVSQPSGWLAGWLAGCLAGWLADWLAGWLAGWLACWLADWLADIYDLYVNYAVSYTYAIDACFLKLIFPSNLTIYICIYNIPTHPTITRALAIDATSFFAGPLQACIYIYIYSHITMDVMVSSVVIYVYTCMFPTCVF